jgi:hypothetical protein
MMRREYIPQKKTLLLPHIPAKKLEKIIMNFFILATQRDAGDLANRKINQ